MSPSLLIGLGSIAAMLLALPIFSVIGLTAVAIGAISPVSIVDSTGLMAWSQSSNYVLISIPLFILLGSIFVRSGIAGEMYDAVSPWLNKVPGKLMQTNVVTSAIFSATAGSSLATVATISSVAVPQIKQNGYNERIFLGSIAAGGTLGILIPPSINFILYGSITNTSIPELYLSGIVPGIILTLLFMLTTAVLCWIRPDWDGQAIEVDWQARIRSLPKLIPPLVLFMIVVGTIYAGIATPTEAASLGVLAVLLLTIIKKRFSFKMLNSALLATAVTNAMLMMIIIAAALLNFAFGLVGFSKTLETYVLGLDLSPVSIILIIVVIYLVLGTFLEGLSLTVLTVPVLAPIVFALGYDPVWFGVLVVLVTEAGLITPPVGMNCYIVQAARGKGAGPLQDVFVGVAPYVSALLIMIGLIIIFPQIPLWYR